MELNKKEKIECVKLDPLVVLKIVKHVREMNGNDTGGQLLGVKVNNVLEVTNCFSFISSQGDEVEQSSIKRGQVEMRRLLREIKIYDMNVIGWFQSCNQVFGSQAMIETQFNYQQSIPSSVVIIYDSLIPSSSVSFKAYRLSDKFMEVYRETLDRKDWDLEIFEELPVRINTSAIVSEWMDRNNLFISTEDRWKDKMKSSLSNTSYLEKQFTFLTEALEDLGQEEYKWNKYFSQLIRFNQANQRKKNEKKTDGGDLVIDSDTLKTPLEPKYYDILTLTKQISRICDDIECFSKFKIIQETILSKE
jgi:hypothetical protein